MRTSRVQWLGSRSLDGSLQKDRMIHGGRIQRMFSALHAGIGARFNIEENTPAGHGQRAEYEGTI